MRFSKMYGIFYFFFMLSACAFTSEIESIYPTAGYLQNPKLVREVLFKYIDKAYSNNGYFAERDLAVFLNRNGFVCSGGRNFRNPDICTAPGRLPTSGAMSLLPPFQTTNYINVVFTIRISKLNADAPHWKIDDIEIK